MRLKLAGNLAAFPFTDGKSGQFVVTVKARDVTLAYADALAAARGSRRRRPLRRRVDDRRRVARTHLRARARSHACRYRGPSRQPAALTIDGSATGPISDFLRFVAESPVDAIIGHITQGAEGTGNGLLALNLAADQEAGVPQGQRRISVRERALKIPGVLRLSQINGKFAFANGDMRARELTAEIVGGPAKFAIGTLDGRVRVTGGGTANLGLAAARVRVAADRAPHRASDWSVVVDVRPEVSTLVLESSLKGAVVDLPGPLGKVAGDAVPLRIELREDGASPDEDIVMATYGRVMQVVAQRSQRGNVMRVDRALVSLGGTAGRVDAARAERPGIWVRGDLPVLNVDDWLTLRDRERRAAAPANAGSPAEDEFVALGGVDLDVGALEVFGRRFNDFKVVARRSSEDWKLELHGRDVAGTATWSAPGGASPNGRIVARLSRFAMPGPAELPPWSSAEKPSDDKAASGTVDRWPELDIAADTFVSSKGRDLGQLELIAKPRGTEWRIEKLALSNDAGRLDANGAWRNVGRAQQTKLDVALDVKDAGAFLTRLGYPDAIKGAPTVIRGQLGWSGSPAEFDYPTLTGAIRIDVGRGRFTKIEPGIGKLLGVLSLQSLPRRITLDFHDVFSDGFAFDEITGDVRVNNGVMSTDNLRACRPRGQGRHRRRRRPREGDAAVDGARAAVVVGRRLRRRGAPVHRQPDHRRGRRRRIAARAKHAEGPDRAVVQLPVHRDRALVGSGRDACGHRDGRRAPGSREGMTR